MAWNTIGHERAFVLLGSGIPQSLLVTGPRQVGKRTLAIDLARALNCSARDRFGEPCGSCRACRLSGEGAYPDVHLLALRQGRQKIGIQDVQALQRELARRPSEGPRRVALIADAERLSAEAENCLLKTLEEPPPHAVIIVTVEEAQALLPTTVSRCRQIRLRPVAAPTIAAHLVERYGVDEDRAGLLAGLSGGRPGWAVAAATDAKRLAIYQAALERLWRASESGKLVRLEIARELSESWSGRPDAVREELLIWGRWWRDLLLTRLGLAEHVVHVDRAAELRRQADRYSLPALRGASATVARALADLDQNVNPRLALDMAVLRLPSAERAA